MPATLAYSRDKGFTANSGVSPQPDGEDDGEFLSVATLRSQYQTYVFGKVLEIEESLMSRQMFHGAQWSPKELRILEKRGQSPITYNEISRKINAIVGLTERLRQDPKAFPRNPRNDEGAEVATSTVRYCLDANDWKTLSSESIRHCAIDGIGGVGLKLRQGDKGDPDIAIEPIFGDDFFYDLRSYRPDFHDARYLGQAKWVDEDECVELFPDLEDEIRSLVENGNEVTTLSPRELKWVYTQERRVRLCEHWYKHKAKWHWAFYIGSTLLDEGVSPFYNERGKTVPRFIMFSAAVDHDGDRYGFVRNFKGAQDEVNQRHSKALFITNSRRLIMDKGAVDDVETARREWARPDGVIEKNPNLNIAPDATEADLAGQMQLMTLAKQWLDQSAPASPIMPGSEALPKNTSGVAINLLQQAGTAELGPFLMSMRGWKLRVYQMIWCMAQRYWTGERWIRVTDDQDLAKFIQINGLDLDQSGRPQLVNYLGQLNVDIIMDEGPDVVNLQQDAQAYMMGALAAGIQVPPQIIAETSPLQSSTKKRWIDMINQPPDPVETAGKQLYVKRIQAEITEKDAGTLNRIAQAAEHASNAHLNAAEIEQRGYQMLADIAGTPQGNPTPPLPSGPMPTPPQAAAPMQAGQLPLPFAGQPAPSPQGSPAIAAPGPQGPPIPGAQQARDGFHYIRDPHRPGKFMKVIPH